MLEAAFSANFANASAVPGFGTGCFEGRGIAALVVTLLSENDVFVIIEDVVTTGFLLLAELALDNGAAGLLFDTLF